ncbi:MAG: hypothetical protein ACK4MD_01465 [Demequina sp.]
MTTARTLGTDFRADAEAPRRMGWFLAGTALCTALYGALTTASTSSCAGGFSAAGYVDSAGQSTTAAPQCVTLTMGPSGAVYGVVVALVILTLVLARRVKDQPALQNRVLGLGMAATGLTAVLCLGLALAWFSQIPTPDWDATEPLAVTVPAGMAVVADIEVEVSGPSTSG